MTRREYDEQQRRPSTPTVGERLIQCVFVGIYCVSAVLTFAWQIATTILAIWVLTWMFRSCKHMIYPKESTQTKIEQTI